MVRSASPRRVGRPRSCPLATLRRARPVRSLTLAHAGSGRAAHMILRDDDWVEATHRQPGSRRDPRSVRAEHRATRRPHRASPSAVVARAPDPASAVDCLRWPNLIVNFPKRKTPSEDGHAMSQSRLPGTPSLLRAINDRAALELLLERGPLTRAQLGELTGLSKVTASQLVERLEERQLVVPGRRAGRRPRAERPALRGRTEQRLRRRRRGRAARGGRRLGRHHRSHHRPGRDLHPRHRRPGRPGARRRRRGGRPGRRVVGPGPARRARHPRRRRSGHRRHRVRVRPAPLAPRPASTRSTPTSTGRCRSRTT